MKKFALIAATFFSSFSVLTAAEKITVTFLHPPGADQSEVLAGSGNSAVGYAVFTDQNGISTQRAVSWIGSTLSILDDVHPYSSAYAVAGDEQAGAAEINGDSHACTWHGNPASFADLHPTILINAKSSQINATTGATQGGYVNMTIIGNSYLYAAIWHGSADSCVILNPNSASNSMVRAVAGTQQAGYATINGKNHAALWAGSPGSFKDLHPLGYDASALSGTDGVQQVGSVLTGTTQYAALWTGTPDSFKNLHPPGNYTSSYAAKTVNNRQAGAVAINGNSHAGIWSGSPESFRDLHTFLPAEYDFSWTNAVWKSGNAIIAGGYAHNATSQAYEAVIWTLTPDPTPIPRSVKISGKKMIITTKSSIVIKGTTTGSVAVVKAKIGTKSVTARGTASWTVKATHLKPGTTKVTITATGPGGASAPARLTIVRK